MHAVEAIAVGVLTLGLVIARPRGLNEGAVALLGASAVLVLGVVPLAQAVRLELATWNVFLFFLGMMAIAVLADHSGAFDVIATAVVRLTHGRVPLLFLAVFALGTLISLFFANDSAALVLTPIVYAIVVRLSLDPLPFVFATTFIADTASIGLPVSNPLNVIVGDAFGLGLGNYVAHMWLPSLIVVVVNIAGFFIIFRRSVRGRFSVNGIVGTSREVGSTFGILTVLAVAYLVASALSFPLGLVAVGGALLLLVDAFRRQALVIGTVLGEISWPIFGFIAGMLLIVQGLHDSGITDRLGSTLAHAAGGSHLQVIAITVVGTGLGANVINNLPMALVMTTTIHALHVSSAVRTDMIYATILGADIGPNLTHLGSLATFLWLFFLRKKGLQISALDYLRIGVLVTPIMMLGAIVGLWLTVSST